MYLKKIIFYRVLVACVGMKSNEEPPPPLHYSASVKSEFDYNNYFYFYFGLV